MRRIVISLVLALFSPFVFILGAEPFEMTGGAAGKAVLAGSIALSLYSAIGHFCIARKKGLGFRAGVPGLVVNGLVLIGWCLLIAIVEKPATALSDGVPMLISGCVGSIVGIWMALQTGRRKQVDEI